MLNKTDKVYHDLLVDILENGHQKEDRTGTGTLSVFGRQIRFNMKDGFPLITTKKLHLRSITHELLWFLKGDTNIQYLKDNGVSIWDEWADDKGSLGPVYGGQWRDWGGRYEKLLTREKDENGFHMFKEKHYPGIDQVSNMMERLKTNPDCRRMIVSAWNVDELDKMALMPCHNFFQVYTRELTQLERYDIWFDNNYEQGMERYFDPNNIPDYDNEYYTPTPTREISLMWNQRSVDTFLGLPFNIASYGMLLEMIAQQTGMVAGELVGNLGDVHLYSNHLEYAKEQLQRTSMEDSRARLVLNKADDLFNYKFEDFEMKGYIAHPNWKNVPIAI